ncbi:MAG: ATP-dependent helicase [Thermodesulfobacteriota bacterium]|nr:ATP-dependent helicase [Thermodesulfobacteriota bacterium]
MQKTLFDLHPSSSEKKQTDSGQRPISSENLNSSQFEAVSTVDGPVMVIAGAGSGKTRTLVYRLAYLVEQGIAPENILLLTFTRKAAREMQNRAAYLLDEKCSRVTGGTFHSVANLLLRRYGHYLGYEPNFTILDRGDSEGIINLLKSSLELAGSGKKFPSKRVVMNILSGAVNKSMAIVDLMEERFPHLLEHLEDIERIHEHYVKFKFENGLMDYDDLLVNLKRLLAEFPEVRDAVSKRFSHIMVDEYQDTNLVQAEIVRLLAHRHDNVMVVGDDAQSIYSFRGANFRNIMDFPGDYKGCKIIKLEENYRSSQAILSVTNEIISLAKEKYTKKLFSRIQKGPAPILHGAVNEERQAGYVAGRIQSLHMEGKPLREIAVLFRSGFHAYKLELELNSRQLPFEKRGGQKLTESAHMKDVLSFLRVLVNPLDHLSWNRILLQLDKVGPKTAQRILQKTREAEDPLAGLKAYPAAKSWREGFLKLVELMEDLSQASSPSASFERAMEYYEPIFERIYHDDYPSRRRDLDQLRDILSGYQDLGSFIDDTALDPPDITPADNGAEDEDRLILSTVHSAKGLEWDSVFIINLAEGKFPSAHAKYNDELEEERRLLYVAATRARENLFFVYPRETIGTDRRRAPAVLTPLLADLPSHVLQSPVSPGLRATPYPGREKKKKVQTSAFAPGSIVKHPFFGRGRVIEASGPRSLDIEFSGHGLKTLHLDFAKLEICDS